MTSSSSKSAEALSAFTSDDMDFLKRLAETPAQRPKDEESPAGYANKALRVAAFLGPFDPHLLLPDPGEMEMKTLLDHCTVSTDGTSSRWTIRAEIRGEILAEAASLPNGIAQGVADAKNYLNRAGSDGGEVTQVLLQVLSGTPPRSSNFAAISKEMLAASKAVVGWLKPVDHQLGFDSEKLLADIELAELLEPFRFLTGFDAASGGDLFVGRLQELRQLRSFVDVLASHSLLESAQRTSRRLFKDQGILFLYGVGGIGKSTLLAKFILQHVGSAEQTPLHFAYLDFDRSTITPAQPITLLLEILRQLGWQLPAARSSLEELRSRIRQSIRQTEGETEVPAHTVMTGEPAEGLGEAFICGDQELPPELVRTSQINDYLHKANAILRNDSGAVPMLLVLDTFEEAQALGDQAVLRIQTFIEAAQEQLDGLKVVVSGRDEVAGLFPKATRMAVNEFGDAASRAAFLERRGLPQRTAASVARHVGGRPLTLLLAARLIKDEGIEELSFSLADRFKGLFNKYLLDGILYQRILSHIHDPNVRALAHPGLVLRRIDAEVLQRVVAPVLGLGEFSEEKARAVLNAFRHQKDLVRSEPDGSVTHRADVREQMLVLMATEKPEMVRQLHTAAASYYAARQKNGSAIETRDRDRVEEIYHLLSLGDSLEQIPQLWLPKARFGLARSVDEIANVAGRGTLKVLLGRVPTAEERHALPAGILSHYATRAIRSAITSQNPGKAQELLEVHARLLPPEFRRSVAPLVLDQCGQWEKAHSLFSRVVDEEGSKLAPADVLTAADFFERAPHAERQRELMAALLTDLGNRMSREAVPGLAPISVRVAALRLKVRQGEYSRHRLLGGELNSIDDAMMAVDGALGTNQRWLITLTDEIEVNGPRMFESMPVTDSVHGQLMYLKHLLLKNHNKSKEGVVGIELCEALSSSKTVGSFAQHFWSASEAKEIVSLVLRHLARPATPQWYIPIAYLLHSDKDSPLFSSQIYDQSLPELPFTASTSLRTTKAVADFLCQLDQLGVLHICLQRMLVRRLQTYNSLVPEIVEAYLAWRRAILFDLDEWFDSLESLHP